MEQPGRGLNSVSGFPYLANFVLKIGVFSHRTRIKHRQPWISPPNCICGWWTGGAKTQTGQPWGTWILSSSCLSVSQYLRNYCFFVQSGQIICPWCLANILSSWYAQQTITRSSRPTLHEHALPTGAIKVGVRILFNSIVFGADGHIPALHVKWNARKIRQLTDVSSQMFQIPAIFPARVVSLKRSLQW